MGDVENLDDYRPNAIGIQVALAIRNEVRSEYRIKKISACKKLLEGLLAENAAFDLQLSYPKLREENLTLFEKLVSESIVDSLEKMASAHKILALKKGRFLELDS